MRRIVTLTRELLQRDDGVAQALRDDAAGEGLTVSDAAGKSRESWEPNREGSGSDLLPVRKVSDGRCEAL